MTKANTPIESTAETARELPLEDSFTIARGTTTATTVHFVCVRDEDGRTGIGAASPSAYYDETPDSVARAVPDLLAAVEAVGDPLAQQEIERRLRARAPNEGAARAAVSMAVHDLAARQRGEGLYRQWGLDPTATPDTSYTISIDDPAAMGERARQTSAAGFDALKVKLGTDDDRSRLRAVREGAPEARIRVDANAAWDRETALSNLDWLQAYNVELLEQPLPAADLAGLQEVTEATAIPVAADESCVTAADVPTVADTVDVVVLKLMKCGGIRPALRLIETARAHDLEVMLGCMVESNASIAPACHLAPLVSYADLDGALLLGADPCQGPDLSDGRIEPDAMGVGSGAVMGSDDLFDLR